MAYFTPIRNIYGLPEVYDDVIIKNSSTITVGGLVSLSSGFATAATAGARVYGVCVGIIGSKDGNHGIPLDKLASGTDYDGTFTAGGPGTQAYAAASDNQTDKKIAARVRIDIGMAMTNEPDAALGTTSGSNLKGAFTDIASATQVDENNATNAFTTVAQLVLLGVGGDINYEDVATTHGVYMIMEKSEIGG